MPVPSTYFHAKCNDDAANTTVTDDGTGANNGVGNVNTSNYSVVGKINDAFELNGSSEYITVDALQSGIASDTTGSFTMWVNLAANSDETLFCFGDTDANSVIRLVSFSTGRRLMILSRITGTVQFALRGDTALTSDGSVWYFVVVVQNGTKPKIYINTVEETLDEVIASTDDTVWFNDIGGIDNGRIGCENQNSAGNLWFLTGKIDDFRYYQNTILSPSDISALYNGGAGTEDDPPIVALGRSQAVIIA